MAVQNAGDARAWQSLRRVKDLRLKGLQREAQQQAQALLEAQALVRQREQAFDGAQAQQQACLDKRLALGRGGRVFSPHSLQALQWALDEQRAVVQACRRLCDEAEHQALQQQQALRDARARVGRAQQQLDQVTEQCRRRACEREQASEAAADEEAEDAAAARLSSRSMGHADEVALDRRASAPPAGGGQPGRHRAVGPRAVNRELN